MRHIIRLIITVILLITASFHTHWSVALVLWLMVIESELAAFVFVRNVQKVTLEKRTDTGMKLAIDVKKEK